MTPGKLDVVIKINQLPTEVTTTKAGWKEFKLECGGRTVTVALRPRMWNKLTEAAANWPRRLAAISGQMGQSVGQGFALSEPSVQVFEGKAKETPVSAEAGAEPPAPETPVVIPPPRPPEPAAKPARRREPKVLFVRRRPAASASPSEEPGPSTQGAGG
jgi:hypothetical protein